VPCTHFQFVSHIHPTSGQPKDLPEVHVVFLDNKERTTKRQEYLVGRRYYSNISCEYFYDLDPKTHSLNSNGDFWHTDVSYEKQPPGLTTLKIDTLPPVGGDTLWASGYLAYEKLSPPIQKLIENLEAVHTAHDQANASAKAGGPVRREPIESIHPVVRTHPVTKRKALYVNPVFTRRIVGLTQRESSEYNINILLYRTMFIHEHCQFQTLFSNFYMTTLLEDTTSLFDSSGKRTVLQFGTTVSLFIMVSTCYSHSIRP
jgi:alpha-ketoglutarate-dependent taurine dioxygenase